MTNNGGGPGRPPRKQAASTPGSLPTLGFYSLPYHPTSLQVDLNLSRANVAVLFLRHLSPLDQTTEAGLLSRLHLCCTLLLLLRVHKAAYFHLQACSQVSVYQGDSQTLLTWHAAVTLGRQVH